MTAEPEVKAPETGTSDQASRPTLELAQESPEPVEVAEPEPVEPHPELPAHDPGLHVEPVEPEPEPRDRAQNPQPPAPAPEPTKRKRVSWHPSDIEAAAAEAAHHERDRDGPINRPQPRDAALAASLENVIQAENRAAAALEERRRLRIASEPEPRWSPGVYAEL